MRATPTNRECGYLLSFFPTACFDSQLEDDDPCSRRKKYRLEVKTNCRWTLECSFTRLINQVNAVLAYATCSILSRGQANSCPVGCRFLVLENDLDQNTCMISADGGVEWRK